jgi:hypothetical protein
MPTGVYVRTKKIIRPKKKPLCHPDKPYGSRDLCTNCYVRFLHKNNPRKAKCHPDKPHYGKDLCWSCYYKLKYSKNPEYNRKKRIINKRWRDNNWTAEHALVKKLGRIKRVYNLSEEAYNNLYNIQNGKCAICDTPGKSLYDPGRQHNLKLFIDHCHKTSLVRGLLCNSCNSAIGLLRERIDLFYKAAAYIELYKEIPNKCQVVNL